MKLKLCFSGRLHFTLDKFSTFLRFRENIFRNHTCSSKGPSLTKSL